MDIKMDMNPISPEFGDAIFVNGPLTLEGVTSFPVETTAQRLRVRLLTFMGEWFADTSYGIPYYQRILGKKVAKSTIDQIFQQAILEERGVREITYFESSLSGRRYSAEFRVKVREGETPLISIMI